MSVRKPYNGDAGYHCSLKTSFGHAVVYDREKGGDWIDADTRWVLSAYNTEGANIGLLECSSEREVRASMKGTRDGTFVDWIDPVALQSATDAGVNTAKYRQRRPRPR